MNNEPVRIPRNSPSTDWLPPAVYAALALLVLWMVIAAWGFAGPDYEDLLLAVISLFFFILMAIPFVIWRVWRRANREAERATDRRLPFADWMSGRFEVWQGDRSGASAAMEIALPIAAAAIGMTAFVIVYHYAAAHAPVAHNLAMAAAFA